MPDCGKKRDEISAEASQDPRGTLWESHLGSLGSSSRSERKKTTPTSNDWPTDKVFGGGIHQIHLSWGHRYLRSMMSNNEQPFNAKDNICSRDTWDGPPTLQTTLRPMDWPRTWRNKSRNCGTLQCWPDMTLWQQWQTLSTTIARGYIHLPDSHRRSKIPKTKHTQQSDRDKAREKAVEAQQKQKAYYDARRATRPNKYQDLNDRSTHHWESQSP